MQKFNAETSLWILNTVSKLCVFMSRIIYKRLDANHKLIFRKFEKEIKVCTKLSADIQFHKYKS